MQHREPRVFSGYANLHYSGGSSCIIEQRMRQMLQDPLVATRTLAHDILKVVASKKPEGLNADSALAELTRRTR